MKLDAAQLHTLSGLLDQALDLSEAERRVWLDGLGQQYASLKPLLEQMLARRDAVETDALIRTLPQFDLADSDLEGKTDFVAGKVIGPYRLLRPLGRGGMGEVWLAERTDGLVRRPVALKLPAIAVARRTIVDRFTRECAILASLTHPHIARLYDVGFTADGQPYLALEYVEGATITAYCDAQRLDLRARVGLFLQVLEAVLYAHSNLILHRDLKPSNILVTPAGEVKLLDFGIAKLMTDGSTQETELTQLGGRALTLDYASAEQILGAPLATASDVYSLGVVLYELLTGERPYRLKRGTRAELEEAILAADVARPSSAVARAESAERRLGSIRSVSRSIAGDLDTITLKALQRLPDQRYRTVSALIDDLQRYLDGRVVLAQPENRWYRTRKFILRNKLATGAVAAVLLSLIAGMGATLWQANIAREKADVAQREATRAQAVQDFLLDIFRTNSDSQPDPIKARQTTARELLDIGAKRVGERLKDAPDVQAEVSETLADMYSQVGLDDEAADMLLQQIAALKKAYGSQDPRVAEALLGYAGTIFATNRRAQAQPALNEARAILDSVHDQTSVTRGIVLAESARSQMYESVPRMRDGADEAVRFFREHHPEHGRLIGVLRLAGRARYWLGDYAGSEAAFLEALYIERARETQNLATVITLLVELADTQVKLVKLDDAERNLRLALAETRKRNGDLHVDTLHVETRLGAFLHSTSRREEGRQWLSSALHKLGQAPGTDSPNVVGPVQMNYAVGLIADGRIDDARQSVVAGVDYQRQHYPTSVAAANSVRYEGAMDVVLGRYDEAGKRFDEAWGIWIATTENAAEPVANNAFLLEQARLFLARHDPVAAMERLAKVSPPKNATSMPLRVDEAAARILLSQALLQQGSVGEAQSSADLALQAIVASPVRDYFQTLEADAALRLGQAQQRAGDAKAARANLERAVKLREVNDDAGQSPWLAEAQIALADCLIDLAQRESARTLIGKATAIEAAHKELGEQFKAPLRRVGARLSAG